LRIEPLQSKTKQESSNSTVDDDSDKQNLAKQIIVIIGVLLLPVASSAPAQGLSDNGL
jgi:hypothetical protein